MPAADQANASQADPPGLTFSVSVSASQHLIIEVLRRPVEFTVYADGVALDEPDVRHRTAWTVERVALAADEYFVVGDNRRMPSAQHEFGTVARQRIVGKVLF